MSYRSTIIYKFTCKHCDCVYIGKTSRRLADRIAEHVPKPLHENPKVLNQNFTATKSNYNLRPRNLSNFNNSKLPSYVDSAIGMHLLENTSCVAQFNDCFKILARTRTQFHLDVFGGYLYKNSKTYFMTTKRVCLPHKTLTSIINLYLY